MERSSKVSLLFCRTFVRFFSLNTVALDYKYKSVNKLEKDLMRLRGGAMRLTKKYKSVHYECRNEIYEIRIYAIKENEKPAERFDLMIYKDFEKVSPFVYSIDMTTHSNFECTWLDPEPAMEYLINLAVNDIINKRIYPYALGKFMGSEGKKPERHLYKV